MQLSGLVDLVIIGLFRGGLYALMAVGLALVFGVMNIAQFAHGEFYMIGAYVAFFGAAMLGVNPLIAWAMAVVVVFVVGVLVERSVFLPLRIRSHEGWVMNAFLLTVGISFVIQNIALAWLGPSYRGITEYWPGNISITPTLNVSADRVAAAVAAIVTIVALWLFLKSTRIGRAIRAVAQDERGATLVGINLSRIHWFTFGLSTALAGLAGAVLLPMTQAYPSVGFKPMVLSWYVVMLVGMGSISGAVVGGFIIGILESFSYYYLGGGWQDVVVLSILILILLFKPSGLFGAEVKGIWER